MNPRLKQQIEIETLFEVLEDLSYYQLLGLTINSEPAEIEPAYRAEARRMHPDRFATVANAQVKRKVNHIYRSINEAFRTLRDPEAREVYNQELEEGHRRMTEEARAQAAAAAAAAANPTEAATTEQGGKYWRMALRNWEEKNYSGCVQMIKFSMMYEPDNETFKEWLGKAQEAATQAEEDRDHNPYKLRI